MNRIILLLALGFAACHDEPGPSMADQTEVAAYGAAMQSCVASARVTDGGLASYYACQDRVNEQYGRPLESHDAGADR